MKVTELPSAAIIAALDRMVTMVQEEEDPVELKAYRALFKKHVPFNLRGYVTAHMVKELAAARPDRNADAQRGEQRRRPRREAGPAADAASAAAEPRRERSAELRRRPRREAAPAAEPADAASAAAEPRRERSAELRRRPRRETEPAAEPADAASAAGEARQERSAEQRRRPRRETEPAAEAADAASAAGEARQERSAEQRRRPRREIEPAAEGLSRLFVSIGRNRRVLPDDLAELISDSVAVEQSELGEIRVLDSYSFVEVPEAVADDIIAALSGTSFKGRRITVDFARAKT